jgi:prepilin-type N-terminal cleavage/methylation domain-containing protein
MENLSGCIMNQAREKQSGFTILELVITVLIVGIVAAIAVPSFSNSIARNQISSTANNLVGAFNLARTEAAQRGGDVHIGSASGTSDWTTGYQIFIDADGDGEYDAGEELRVYEAISGSLSLNEDGGEDTINFNAMGFSSTAITFSLCSNVAALRDRQIDVTLSGRVNITQIDCP